jgi:hypothetical protein
MFQVRNWATPLTAGAFIVLAVTGVLMFFHLDRGLNHEAHEWIGWALLIGATAHIYSNFLAFRRHLSGRLGRILLASFIVILGLSFISPSESQKNKGPGWAPPLAAMARMPLKDLAQVARMTETELRNRLMEFDLAAKSAESIEDLAGSELRDQIRALNFIFPDED